MKVFQLVVYISFVIRDPIIKIEGERVENGSHLYLKSDFLIQSISLRANPLA